jgi:hypothetical protein
MDIGVFIPEIIRGWKIEVDSAGPNLAICASRDSAQHTIRTLQYVIPVDGSANESAFLSLLHDIDVGNAEHFNFQPTK